MARFPAGSRFLGQREYLYGTVNERFLLACNRIENQQKVLADFIEHELDEPLCSSITF
jgi:hypothetical protein